MLRFMPYITTLINLTGLLIRAEQNITIIGLMEFKNIKSEDREEYATTKRLRKLQQVYCIAKADLSHKTAGQLSFK